MQISGCEIRGGMNIVPPPPAPAFSYYRGTTEYTSDYTIGAFSSINDIYSTAVKKYGTASLYIPYVNDTTRYYVDTPITLLTGDWTADFWVRMPTSNSSNFFTLRNSSNNDLVSFWTFPITNWRSVVYSRNAAQAGSATSSFGTHSTGALDTWFHIWIQRSGSALAWWWDGANRSQVNDIRWSAVGYDRIRIGCADETSLDAQKATYIDGFHISTNDRLSSGFSHSTQTVPTAAPSAISTTVWLANFDN